jgi:hypothetical protein
MIIGTASIDPRNVSMAMYTKQKRDWFMTLAFSGGMEAGISFPTEREAIKALELIDKYAHKGLPADAVSDRFVDVNNQDDEECRIGF